MSALPAIDIRPEHWAIVADILKHHLPHDTVWAFGSRATFTAKPYSDLDLPIIAAAPLPIALIAALEEDFTESALPFKVDVMEWAASSDRFRDIVRRNLTAVWPSANPDTTQTRQTEA